MSSAGGGLSSLYSEAGLQAANAAGTVLTAVRGVSLSLSERIAQSLPIEELHLLGSGRILPNAATDDVRAEPAGWMGRETRKASNK